MIIDFHTHAFPDTLAAKALDILVNKTNNLYTPVSDATISGLLKNMDDWNIDASVVLPVITKQSQVKTANEWARSVCTDRIICFGGVFPHTDDYKRDIDFVASLGLKGLKFHPEYQNFQVDDERMLKIYDYALSKELILLYHAGFDPGTPPPHKSSPRQFARVIRAMRGGVIVAAHLGGQAQWDDVEEYLAGENIYMDTSVGFEYFSSGQFLRIAKKHGTDKLLFASDSPWSNAKTELEHINALPLPENDINAILGGNAKRILKL